MTRFRVELHAQLKLAQLMKLLIRNIPAAHWLAQLLAPHIVAAPMEIFRFSF
jgi:hypothetical protein